MNRLPSVRVLRGGRERCGTVVSSGEGRSDERTRRERRQSIQFSTEDDFQIKFLIIELLLAFLSSRRAIYCHVQSTHPAAAEVPAVMGRDCAEQIRPSLGERDEPLLALSCVAICILHKATANSFVNNSIHGVIKEKPFTYGVMNGRAILQFPLRLPCSLLLGVRMIGAERFAHSRGPKWFSIKAAPARYHGRQILASFCQSIRVFSADSSATHPTLTVSANCARRIQLLRSQKATTGSGETKQIIAPIGS